MARILAGLCLGVALAIPSTTPDQTFTVTGRISGLDGKDISLQIDDESRPDGVRIELVPVVNERFTVKAPITALAYVQADLGVDRLVKKTGDGIIATDSALLTFFVFPGARVTVDGDVAGDFVNAYPAGDRANDDLAVLNRQLYPLMNQRADIAVRAARQPNAARKAAVLLQAEPITAKINEICKAFLRAQPTSPAAVWVLSDMMAHGQLTDKEALAAFKTITDARAASEPYYTAVERRITALKRSRVGSVVPDVRSVLTYDGAPFDLVALRGRYVAIDFWGTWCGPCMNEIPRMQEYQARYAEKVQFVGIAQGSPEADWRATISKAPLAWPHLRNGRGDEDFVVKFNVEAFPTKFLVDPKGKIIGRFVGTGDAFYRKLDSLFGK